MQALSCPVRFYVLARYIRRIAVEMDVASVSGGDVLDVEVNRAP